jgi:RNA polymerase sigma-70 factor (ECF subfamily)
MLGNDEDARDATQDTMVKVLRNLHRYDLGRPFSSWAFSIARNTCIDEYRKRKRRAWDEPGEVVDRSPSPLQHFARGQRATHLLDSLSELSPMYREILVMYHFEHLKYAEIAEVLAIPMGTVMNRIFRARRKLRAIYETRQGDSP